MSWSSFDTRCIGLNSTFKNTPLEDVEFTVINLEITLI